MTEQPKIGIQLGLNGYGPFGWWPQEDLPRVLAVVANCGYDGAEIMTNVLTAESGPAVKEAFAAAGLTVAALHLFSHQVDDPGKCADILARMAIVGCSRLIISSEEVYTTDGFHELAAVLAAAARAAAGQGVQTYFHPHHIEYVPLRDDPSRRGLEVLAEDVSPELMLFNFDWYWAYRGGADPVETITRYGIRSRYHHVRDGDEQRSQLLGTGKLDLDGCLRAAHEHGGSDWLVYEEPEPQLPPTELCRQARSYIVEHYPQG